MELETKCLQSGYCPENGMPRTLPIYQSTTYKYDDAEALGKLFDPAAGDRSGRLRLRRRFSVWFRWLGHAQEAGSLL